VYTAVSPRLMGALFGEYHRRLSRTAIQPGDAWFQRKTDFAWLLGWVSKSMFVDGVRRLPTSPHHSPSPSPSS
jgi:hypothetical protein